MLSALIDLRRTYRRDALDKDYPNEYFRKLAHPEEAHITETELFSRKDHMILKPVYGNVWKQVDEGFERILPKFEKKIKGKVSIHGLAQSISALSIEGLRSEGVPGNINHKVKMVLKRIRTQLKT